MSPGVRAAGGGVCPGPEGHGSLGGEGSRLPLWSLWAGAAWCRGGWGGAAGQLDVPYAATCSTGPGAPRALRLRAA